jgi:hypothetical protein
MLGMTSRNQIVIIPMQFEHFGELTGNEEVTIAIGIKIPSVKRTKSTVLGSTKGIPPGLLSCRALLRL